MSYWRMSSDISVDKNEKLLLNYDKETNLSFEENTSFKSIGDFVIGDQLGEGTFSKVCIGLHKSTNEKVAIKILDKSRIKEINDRLLIEKEVNIHKRLRHNNIIQQYCVLETETKIYIVTEYCSNGELFDFIVSKVKLYENEACRIFQQLIAGLEYLHKQRIAHRDLKPENLLFDSKRVLKIADFGLSNAYDYNGKLSTPCGSPCYAAPEMVLGHFYNGMAVDVWSAGIVLYTMVCGSLPFEVDNQDILFRIIAKGIFALPTHLSPQCKHLLQSILVTDPSTRFSFEQIKNHPWFTATNNALGRSIYFNSPGIFINQDIIPLDDDVIIHLVNVFHYDLRTIISDIILNKRTVKTTSYYLSLKKRIKNGYKTISDISFNSDLFIDYIESSISKMIYFSNDYERIIDYYYKDIKKTMSSRDSIDRKDKDRENSLILNGNHKEGSNNKISGTPLSSRLNYKNKFNYPSIQFDKFINKKKGPNGQTPEVNIAAYDNYHHNRDKSDLSSSNTNNKDTSLHLITNSLMKMNISNNKQGNGKRKILNQNIPLLKIDQNNSFDKKQNKELLNEGIKVNISTERNNINPLHKKKKISLDSSLKSIDGPSPEKTPKQKLLNTSIIFDNKNRSNSPLITSYCLRHKQSNVKAHQKFDNQHKATHYSQDITKKISASEIAELKNTGNSFITSQKTNNISPIPKNKTEIHQSFPIDDQTHINNDLQISSIKSMKENQNLETLNDLNLKKAVIILNKNASHSLTPTKGQSKSVAVKERSEEESVLINERVIHKKDMNSKEKEIIINRKKGNSDICCKRTLTEIKEVVNSMIGKNDHTTRIDCKYYSRYQSFNFILVVISTIAPNESSTITLKLLKGNVLGFKMLIDRMKNKLTKT